MDTITAMVKDMYERYPFPGNKMINVAYGNRIKNDLKSRGFNTSNINILDAGCGSGEKVISLAKVFTDSEVFGWDISSKSINQAKELALQEKVKSVNFECVDLLNLGIENYKNFFDVILSWGVIHHLSDTVKGMRNLGLCLKPTGLLYVWVYALNSLERIETKLFRDCIKILLKKKGFSYEEGIKIAHAIKGQLKMNNYSGAKDILMRIKWFLDKDVDKKQVILHILKNFRKIKFTTDYNVNIVDSFLHANEKDYDVKMVFEEADKAGLEVIDFIDLPKRIEDFIKSDYVKELYYSLDFIDRLEVMEKLTNPGHHLFLARRR